MDMSSGGWLTRFKTLHHDYDHHIEEEEDEIFKKAKDAIGGGSGWPWAAAFKSWWRMKAFAAAVRLAMRMPAAPCRARIAESHSLDSMLMKCMLAPASARFATDLAVLYGLLCSCACVPLARAVPVGVEGKNNHYLKLIAIVDSTVR